MRTDRVLVLVVALLTTVRLVAARTVGYGDSEALYASYALFASPAYRDHPGLIGALARAIAAPGQAPTPWAIHLVTTALAAGVPFVAVAAARAFGSTRERAFGAGIVFATVPVCAVGSFAFAPDTLLAPLWLGALGLFAFAVRRSPSSTGATFAFLGLGLFVGLAILAKVTGLLLLGALVLGCTSRDARAHLRTPWPWAALALAAVLILPFARHEIARDFPMVRHRFVATQGGAGVSLRNAGAVVLGQLLYLSPPFAFLAVLGAGRLFRADGDAALRTLRFAFLLPLVVLVPFCLWSRVAEPHWLLPPFFAIPIWIAAGDDRSRSLDRVWPRLVRAAVGIGIGLTLLVHGWVLLPAHVRLVPKGADLRMDIATELFGWPEAANGVAIAVKDARGPDGPDREHVVVVGPHWIVCAQLRARLSPAIGVGCLTATGDDFDDWLPRKSWERADVVVYVTDARFDEDPEKLLPRFSTVNQTRIDYEMAGRPVRTFTIATMKRLARAGR